MYKKDKIYYLTAILTLSSFLTFAQCENLEGNKEGMKNWKENYFNYFNIDTTSLVIKSDSVLIYYFSNKENETNYGMPCCYFVADKYAKTELDANLKLLYKKLEKQDSINFQKAQQAWQAYYDNEWEFLRQAFIAYANFSKYGQGREIMIATQSTKYQMIKDRILTIQSYIEIATPE
jgi:uncharacterized protein YecT (DUF1311 family)